MTVRTGQQNDQLKMLEFFFSLFIALCVLYLALSLIAAVLYVAAPVLFVLLIVCGLMKLFGKGNAKG